MRKSEKGIQTFLGPQTTMEGKIVFEGALRLDGHFTGTIESADGVVIVGEKAVIQADILVHTATVSGEVRGNIRATERIELNPPARVFGDLCAPEVIITNVGVVFDGKCNTSPRGNAAIKAVKV